MSKVIVLLAKPAIFYRRYRFLGFVYATKTKKKKSLHLLCVVFLMLTVGYIHLSTYTFKFDVVIIGESVEGFKGAIEFAVSGQEDNL